MPNHHLKPLSPLGHDAPVLTTIGPVTISEKIDCALASLATRRDQDKAVAAAAKTLGIPLPGAGHFEQSGDFGAFWLGPDQWMVEAPFASHEDIVAILKPAFGNAASITEQTDAWVRFDVSGKELPSLFERLCNFDLRKRGKGSATRTVIEHLGCYVVVREEGLLSVIGPRSSAQSLHHALVAAAQSAF